jgi:hypothetical protein
MRREKTHNGIKWDEAGQIGQITGPDGKPASEIPAIVLNNMFQRGQIPIIGEISADGETVNLYDCHLADERQWCRHAIDGDTAGAARCNCLRRESGWRTWCSLNGAERGDLCVFDESSDAPVWAEIRAYAKRWGG